MNNFTIVSIEGNIGSGKSTLLANLRSHYGNNTYVMFLKEPVDEWEKIRDENDVTMLEKFYEDPNKYAFSFQMMAYVSRIKVLRDVLKHIKTLNLLDKKIILITERSLYTDKFVFAKMLFDSKKIEHINYQIYLNWFDTFSEEFPVHKVVYVKTTPEKCHSRIITRSREGESNINLEYLSNCNSYHDNMLDMFDKESICTEQLIIDGNIDIYKNKNQVEKWINEIDTFINK